MHTVVRTALVVALYTATVASGVAVRAVYVTPESRPAAVAPAPARARAREAPVQPGWGVAPPPATAPAPPSPPPPAPAEPAVTPPPPVVAPGPAAAGPAPASAEGGDRSAIWYALAECESGAWGVGNVPVPGSARWDVVDEVHQGGLQIRAGQWDQHRPAGFPTDAHVATPTQQIAVAEIILAGQGWRAWPTCGPRVGLQRLVGEEIVEPD